LRQLSFSPSLLCCPIASVNVPLLPYSLSLER
jgi:hypothetical protein